LLSIFVTVYKLQENELPNFSAKTVKHGEKFDKYRTKTQQDRQRLVSKIAASILVING
jgi:hypothetical protein